MNTADLHPKRFQLSLTVGQLRQLLAELLAMEHAPHQAPVPADKQLERDRAGEQLTTHVAMLVEDTRAAEESERVQDSVPLLRAAAKYLLTACDRCRRAALRAAQAARTAGQLETQERALGEVRVWDDTMRQLSGQHGVTASLREMVDPVPLSGGDLEGLGLGRSSLFNQDELLARF